MATYVRNIQGHPVRLTLVEVDPHDVVLDATNPRVGFSMRQLKDAERNEEACTLLLTSQEATEDLKRSLIRSNGVQEPIYLRADGRVAEGNRRVVALRAAKEAINRGQHLAMSEALRQTSSAPRSSSRYFRRFVPGIGTMSSPCASTHASASCAGVHFFSPAICSTRSTSRRFC